MAGLDRGGAGRWLRRLPEDEWLRPDPRIKSDRWWRPGWIPITAADGDHLVVDLDPADGGTVGQVFAFSHETGPGKVAARSFGEWLAIYADELEAGVIDLAEGDDDDEGRFPDLRTWPE